MSLRERLAPRRRVKDAVNRIRYQRVLRSLAGPKIIRAFAEAYPNAFFVEVGSNDGQRFDQLSEHIGSRGWNGIMVEPVPYVFEQLRGNYGHVEGVRLENVAIADRDGRLPFYHLVDAPAEERAHLPDYYDALGSFSRETIAAHGKDIPDIEARIVQTEVEALTFDSLLARHGVERLDLILVDTEGYDYEILKTVDLARHRPRLVVYEHYHLSDADRAACRAMLEAAGYETLEEGMDTFCLDPRDDALTRRWRGLEPGVEGASAAQERA